MWSRALFLLPESHPPPQKPPTHTPAIVSPYIYLTALCAPSKTFMTVWFNQQRQIITFYSFISLMWVKGSGSTDWTDVESKVFGSVVSWLDEQMQTWLPLCESSLLTTVTKIQSEVFLPVYIQSRMLAAGAWIWTCNSTTICFTKHPSFVLFWLYAFTKYYLANEKEEKFVCLVVNDKLNQCRPIVRQLSWNQLAAECYFANEWKMTMFGEVLYVHTSF